MNEQGWQKDRQAKTVRLTDRRVNERVKKSLNT